MSVPTTKTLTRKQAISIIAGKIFTATNDQLENMLKAVDGDGLDNFVIIDELLANINQDSLAIDRKDIYG